MNVTVINAATREILRELTIDLCRGCQPTGTKNSPNPQNLGSDYSDVVRHHIVGLTGFEPVNACLRIVESVGYRIVPETLET